MTVKTILAAIATLLFFQKAISQAPEKPPMPDVDTIEQVVVSASKFAESRRNVPNQVQTISTKEIGRVNAANTADLLTATGEIFAQKSQQGGGSPVLRGLESNRILLTLDGVRMNNAICRGGHLQNVLRLDQFSLDRAEVVGGPGSLVYGSDALGGVIGFFTKKPTFSAPDAEKMDISGSVVARFGSAGEEKTGHADLHFGGKTWASYTSASFSDFGDLQQGSNRTDEFPDFGKRGFSQKFINGKDSMVANGKPNVQLGSGYHQANFLQKFRFQKKENREHGLTFLYTTTGDVPRYDRLSEGKNGLPRSAEWHYGPEKWFLANYQLRFRPVTSKACDIGVISVVFQQIKESRHTRNWDSPDRKSQSEKVGVFALNADFSKLGDGHRLRYGLDISANNVQSEAYFFNILTGDVDEADTRYPDGGSSIFAAAGYITDQWFLAEKWTANYGVRYTFSALSASFVNRVVPFPFNDVQQNNGALSGNLGLVYLPSNSLKISILGSTGYRTPNIDDVGKVFESTRGEQLIVPNPALKPEFAWNGETTIETLGKGRFQGSLTGYAMLLTDILGLGATTFEFDSLFVYDGTPTSVFSTQNLGKGRILGTSGRVAVALNDWLKLNATASFARGRLLKKTGNTPLDHIPPMLGRVGILGGRGKWGSEVFALFNGKKPLSKYRLDAEDNEKYATADGSLAWWTLNWRANFQASKRFEIQAAIENIFDKNYRPFASGISAAGRDFRVTVRYGF